jgi:ankyrin repeat protein
MSHIVKFISILFMTILSLNTALKAEEIHDAIAAGDLNKVKALLEADSALLELKDSNGNTPLNVACGGFKKKPAIAKYLIDKGANVNTKNNNGSTPLHGVCSIGISIEIDLVKLLIFRGADINAREIYGGTPLRYAIGSLDIASFLIEHGADINATSDNNTILHYALTFCSNDDLSKLLIEKGAKINQIDKFGNTELHIAAMRGFTEVVGILVKHGANINALNKDSHTPLYYAAKHGYRNAADKLIALGADKHTIIEINYGKAPQLSAAIKQNEAYLWYMKAGGYAVKTKNHLLILSQLNFNSTPEAGLANGQINPDELAGQNICVLTSYPRADFTNTNGDRLTKQIPETKWIFYSSKPTEVNKSILDLPSHHLIGPNNNISFEKIKVHATPRIPGVGFLFEVDGLKIFDCKSFASTNEASRVEEYQKAIDSLKLFGPIDIVILPVNGHIWVAYEPYLYLIDKLSPKAVFLTGGEGDPSEYSKCTSFLKARVSQVQYPESKIEGDRFHYSQDSFQR